MVGSWSFWERRGRERRRLAEGEAGGGTEASGCLMECDRWDYDVSPSYAHFPNDAALAYYQRTFNFSPDYIK